ncbi:MAG: hypothetical protein ABI616_01795 [Pseudomonadota bacterium]
MTPYDFDEFQRRSLRAAASRKSWALSAVASVAVLGLVVSLAVVTQRTDGNTYAMADPVPAMDGGQPGAEAVTDYAQPALVDLGQLAMRSELEDRIAWYDAQLSVGRVSSATPEQLRQLESTRKQLADSLQHVSYAHTLLSL